MYLSPEQANLLNAAIRGDAATVQALLARGVDPNTPDNRQLPRNRTALMHAAKNGHLEVVEILLRAGAKVDIQDRGMGVSLPGGNTALLLALKNKHCRIAQRLLETGADPNVTSGGVTVFGQACYLGDLGLVRKLLDLRLNPDLAIRKRADRPLVAALYGKRTEIVRLLVSAGANPNLRTARGIHPLHIAVNEGLVEAVQLLLHRGADPNATTPDGLTPLMTAVLRGEKEIVKILLQRDAAPNRRTPRGETALDFARQKLDRKPDSRSFAPPQEYGLDLPEYLALYQEIIALLQGAKARSGADLPPLAPRRAASARPPSRREAEQQRTGPRLGAGDFLQLLRYTEPEFAVIAVHQPLEKVAAALRSFRRGRQWSRNVPRLPPGRLRRAGSPLTALVKVKRNAWTLIFRSVFRLKPNEYRHAVEDAQELSSRLKTKAIAFIREKTAEAVGYDLFQDGKPLEHAQWIEGSSFCWFESRFRRKPRKDELGEDYTDKILRQQGIYLPACYPQIKKNRPSLCVEKVSASAILRADTLLLPAPKPPTPSKPRIVSAGG